MDANAQAAENLANTTTSKTIDLEQALAADAVMICTPTPTHADLIEQAAARRKAVFCEKPSIWTPHAFGPV
jgi:myo-inositol 2-dehydrogenase / D-chiro-inositol 1-dehydrogenase